MKAVVLRTFGGPEQLTEARAEMPNPGPGHVLLRAAASSVNPVDCRIRAGNAKAIVSKLPKVLHGDVSGTVEALGPGVSRFAVGDQVFGCIGGYGDVPGALSEFVAADERLLAHAPSTIPLADAAALPLVSITVEEGFAKCPVGHKEHILVHAGAGGVGHMALQLAKARGAVVSVTCSTGEKARAAAALGADNVVFYREEAVPAYVKRLTGGEGFPVVFDTVGGRTFDDSIEALRPYGSLVTVQARGIHDLTLAQARAASIHVVFMLLPILSGMGRERYGALLTRIAQLVDGGVVRPLIHPERFPLERTADAHRLLESGRAVGKVIIDIG